MLVLNAINFLILIFLINTTLSENVIKVNLHQGVVSGVEKKTLWKKEKYYSFQGIPYAQPPVGNLRFQPPKPVERWEGTYEAHQVKPTCLQFSSRNRNKEPIGISGSEDCLYLNVFTPNIQGNYPVIVFDYNDNFVTGFNGTDTYSPDFFMEEDVIVVTISHRLGIFGYLTTEDDVIPANNGIRDFILGLKWVQDNIKIFGGDPQRVTLMGNRGGAVIIDILLYSKAAKGLFSAAMIQSGTAMEAMFFNKNARSKSFKLAEQVNINADDSKALLEGLQKIEGEQLITKAIMLTDIAEIKRDQIGDHPFKPIIENDHEDAIITTLPEKDKIVNDVPVLIGLTSREGLDLASHFLIEPRILNELIRQKQLGLLLPIRVGYRFNNNSAIYKHDIPLAINRFYYKRDQMTLDNTPKYAILVGDEMHNYALNYAVRKISKELQSAVYYYMFDFRGSLNENFAFLSQYSRFPLGDWGATVTDELCYLFLCTRIKDSYKEQIKMISEQPEVKVLRKMVRMWTNFAKTGNPTPEKDDILKGVIWKPINKESKDLDYLHINKHLKMNVNPLGTREVFWDELLDKYGKLAIDGVVGEDEVEGEIPEEAIEETVHEEL